MIGISQIKKRLFIGIAIGTGIGIVGIALTLWWSMSTIKTYENGTNSKYLSKYTVELLTFNKDVLQGETVTSDMVNTTRVHVSTQPQDAIYSAGSAVGQIVKYNVSKNIPITSNMLTNKIIGTDVRIQEISQVLLPTDVKEKDFVDFRIKLPSGIEYIVMPQKQIQKIIGNTMWLNLSEEERAIMNAATVDTYANPGLILYAVQYADPQTQIKIDAVEAAEKAKTFLSNKILADAKAGKIPSVDPSPETSNLLDIENKNAAEENEETDVENIFNKPEKPVNSVPEVNTAEMISFKDKITELLLKYAIDYRYYVESYNKVIANYQPNHFVMAAMKENRYIVDEAKEKLSESVRASMMLRNTLFEEANKDKYGAIVEGAQAAASTQSTMRNSTLTQEPNN